MKATCAATKSHLVTPSEAARMGCRAPVPAPSKTLMLMLMLLHVVARRSVPDFGTVGARLLIQTVALALAIATTEELAAASLPSGAQPRARGPAAARR